MTGMGPLVKLALRRDRILLPVWVYVFIALTAGSAFSARGLYPSVESRVSAAAGVNSAPALRALYGPVLDPTSPGALAVFKLIPLGAAAVALLAAMLVVRHTRAEEEAGRYELVGAGAVDRRSPLTAGLLVGVLASVLVGVVSAAGLVVGGLGLAGSVMLGLGWAGCGLVFAAVAGVTGQLASTGRSANTGAALLLGIAYVLRAVADSTGAGRLAWLSPIGWVEGSRPYAGERWWVLLLFLALAAGLTGLAYRLAGRRDLGAGLLPDRPGPARAGRGLRSSLGLAWRLQRSSLLGWLLAYALLGLVFGSIGGSVDTIADSPGSQDLIRRLGGQQGLVDAFFGTELGIVGLLAAAYAVQAVLRLRTEETAGRAEPVLTAGVSRLRWAGGHLLVSLLGSTLLLAVVGAFASLTAGRDLLGAALVIAPAVWVLAGLTLLLVGVLPRLAVLAWALLVGALLLGQLGSLLRLGQAALDLSPFTHVPHLPGGAYSTTPFLWLLLVSGLAVATGLWTLRRRDVPA